MALRKFLLVAIAAGTLPAAVIFSDGDFTTGWTDTMVVNQNLASFTYLPSNPVSGGNTGAFRQENHTMVQNSSASLAAGVWMVLYSAATYNPSAQGAIMTVDFSYDLLRIAGGNTGYGLGIVQNGRNYRAYFGDLPGASWAPFSHSALTSSTVIEMLDSGPYPHLDVNSHPDFTLAGSNIQFGYLVLNSISGSINHTTGIDNWQVTLNNAPIATPEPSGFVLAGSALLAIAGLRIRKPKRSNLR